VLTWLELLIVFDFRLLRVASTLVAVLTAALLPGAAAARDDRYNQLNENVFFFGGLFSTGFFGDTLLFWDNEYEDGNVFLGAGYQNFFYGHPGGLKLGVEAGTALRLGEWSSAELWGGAVVRFDVVNVGGFRISPAMTAGLSLVTDTIGVERDRAADIDRSVPLLYYLGPEISISHESNPNWELLGRIQHRSGGFGTIARIDGSNAVTLGIRYKY
jgi:hypothetical protein